VTRVGAHDDPPARGEVRLVLDRREGGLCVLIGEAGAAFEMPGWFAPVGARDGDTLAVRAEDGADGERRLTVRVDRDATGAAREEAATMLHRLRAQDPGDDIVL
jgi:hypothetical protein